MERRHFLKGAGVAVAAALAPSGPLGAATRVVRQGDAALKRVFDAMFADLIARNPTVASALGLDKGANAFQKRRLDTRPTALARAQDLAVRQRQLAELKAIDPRRLSDRSRLNREIVIYDLETHNLAPAKFNIDSVESPYLITQQGGA